MKRFFFILVMVLLSACVFAVQPVRKPFLQIKIDGKSYKSGDVLTVTAGQKLLIEVELEGGRRDFCKFPDTYADIAGTAQIMSRGKDGLTYQQGDVLAEWKIKNEATRFVPDEFIKAHVQANQSNAELVVTKSRFSQSFMKVNRKAVWQFTQGENSTLEENSAEATVYFKLAGASDVWFTTQNIQAGGMKSEPVSEKLKAIQAACDTIESNFYNMQFSLVQQSVKKLQAAVNSAKTTIDEAKASNPAYQIKVSFIGLPSDNPYQDISTLLAAKTIWNTHEMLINDLKLQLGSLTNEPTVKNREDLIKLIGNYAEWQTKLDDNVSKILNRYIPEIKVEGLKMPEDIQLIAREKKVTNYPQTIKDFHTFLDQRMQSAPEETKKISSTHSRLQAVRLFDGMLRSYFSSINWADWKNTRE